MTTILCKMYTSCVFGNHPVLVNFVVFDANVRRYTDLKELSAPEIRTPITLMMMNPQPTTT